jgi:hypothetical protein
MGGQGGSQYIVHQCAKILGIRCRIVEPIRREIGIPESSQIRDNDFKSGAGERPDVPVPDAFGLREAVNEEQWIAAHPFTDVSQRKALTDFAAMNSVVDVGKTHGSPYAKGGVTREPE